VSVVKRKDSLTLSEKVRSRPGPHSCRKSSGIVKYVKRLEIPKPDHISAKVSFLMNREVSVADDLSAALRRIEAQDVHELARIIAGVDPVLAFLFICAFDITATSEGAWRGLDHVWEMAIVATPFLFTIASRCAELHQELCGHANRIVQRPPFSSPSMRTPTILALLRGCGSFRVSPVYD
jgi:hypothetical protein